MKISFEEWKKEIDKILVLKCGLGVDDLPDYCYRDSYDDGMSAKATASAVYKNAKEDMGL